MPISDKCSTGLIKISLLVGCRMKKAKGYLQEGARPSYTVMLPISRVPGSGSLTVVFRGGQQVVTLIIMRLVSTLQLSSSGLLPEDIYTTSGSSSSTW